MNQFVEFFTYKQYWEDSYTKFSNEIGLTAGGKFIDESADVVLDLPSHPTSVIIILYRTTRKN
ncbi:site-specific DNA-methyltransferase [Lactococcus garvieae]|uniref:site-specific DNA-methyltransferase n=1 Tax=Lactococcus garvieae TaxID=1363 RepID=UPI0022E3A0D4|nr:site-specific DNA-methyltransferase [Lactococcus garvieae]